MDKMYFLLTVIYQIVSVRRGSALKSTTISPSRNLNWTKTSGSLSTERLHQSNKTADLQETSTHYGKTQWQELILSSTPNPTSEINSTFHPLRQNIVSSTSLGNYSIKSGFETSPCYQCKESANSQGSRDFSYIMLGVGVGSAFFIFTISLFVVVCKKIYEKRQNQRDNHMESVRAYDGAVLQSKESIFTSSTLQLHTGLNNDGLELDSFQSPTIPIEPHNSSSESQQHSDNTFDSLHVNTETSDIPLASFQSTSFTQLESELEFSASIKLLQDWNGDLEDHDSNQFKELKLEVEQSIKEIYGMKEEFRGVKVSTFREGSVIADVVLIVLAAIQDPFRILEMSVSTGKLGKLRVDSSYFLKGRGENGINVYSMDKNGKSQLECAGKKEVIEDYEVEMEISECTECNYEISFDDDMGSIKSSMQNDSLHSNADNIDTGNVTVSAGNDWMKRKSSLNELLSEKDGYLGKEARLKGPQHSLADLRNLNASVDFREQRDSGIGSMQELSSSEIKLNRTNEQSDDVEKVFCNVPENVDMPLGGDEVENYGNAQKLDQIDEDIPHVALYNFQAENDHELSVKQGDVVHVIKGSSGGWMKVVNADEQIGWVPESFLVHVSRSQLSDTQETVETLKFLDNILEQLDNESGSGSSTVSTPDDDESDESTKKGLATADEKENVNLGLKKLENKLEIQVKRCKSVYRFDGKDSSELSFQVGEIIEVHKISEVGWWKGRLRDNRGWFPSSYVMPLNEESEVPIRTKKNSEFERSVSDRARQSDRLLCLRSESDICRKLDSNIKRRHKYQSLQRAKRRKDEYAHLYFQILRRESRSDENIPGLFKSASLNVIDNINVLASDWPNRAPPAPPTEDVTDRTIREHSSSCTEPPNRPVPHPPSSKPSFTKIDVVKRMVVSDRILVGNITPPLRTKHDNVMPIQTQHKDGSYVDQNQDAVSSHNESIT